MSAENMMFGKYKYLKLLLTFADRIKTKNLILDYIENQCPTK